MFYMDRILLSFYLTLYIKYLLSYNGIINSGGKKNKKENNTRVMYNFVNSDWFSLMYNKDNTNKPEIGVIPDMKGF